MSTKAAALVYGVLLILPGAFFGALLGGSLCYNRDHARYERTRRIDQGYSALLSEYEGVGALAGASPGILCLLVDRRRHRAKVLRAKALRAKALREGA